MVLGKIKQAGILPVKMFKHHTCANKQQFKKMNLLKTEDDVNITQQTDVKSSFYIINYIGNYIYEVIASLIILAHLQCDWLE